MCPFWYRPLYSFHSVGEDLTEQEEKEKEKYSIRGEGERRTERERASTTTTDDYDNKYSLEGEKGRKEREEGRREEKARVVSFLQMVHSISSTNYGMTNRDAEEKGWKKKGKKEKRKRGKGRRSGRDSWLRVIRSSSKHRLLKERGGLKGGKGR